MAGQANLTFQESLELHEWLQSEGVGVKRMQASLSQVRDQELKSLIQTSLDAKQARLSEIGQFLGDRGGIAPTQESQSQPLQ